MYFRYDPLTKTTVPIKCQSKQRTCSYIPSKRGGPRPRKKKALPVEATVHEDDVQKTITPVTPGLEDSKSSKPPFLHQG